MPRSLSRLMVISIVDDDAEVVEPADGDLEVAADGRLSGVRGFVGLLDGDDAAIRPGGLGDGADGIAERIGADVEFLAASANGTKHAADAEVASVGIGEGDLQFEHGGLHGEHGVLPAFEAVDGHVGVLGRGRNTVELFALGFELCTLPGVRLHRRGVSRVPGAAREREQESWKNAGSGKGSQIQHVS